MPAILWLLVVLRKVGRVSKGTGDFGKLNGISSDSDSRHTLVNVSINKQHTSKVTTHNLIAINIFKFLNKVNNITWIGSVYTK